MEEDMIQLRLGQERLAGEIATLTRAQEVDRKQTATNHVQNRDSIHKLFNDLQTMTNTIYLLGNKIDNYLLVQQTIATQKEKAWWKQPLGTAMIVAVVTVGWTALQHIWGWK